MLQFINQQGEPSLKQYIILSALVFSHLAHSKTTVEIGFGGYGDWLTLETQAAMSRSQVTAAGIASANSDTGLLRISTRSEPQLYSDAQAWIEESWNFTGNQGGIAYIDWRLDGSIQDLGYGRNTTSSFGSLSINIGASNGITYSNFQSILFDRQYNIPLYACAPYTTTDCNFGIKVHKSGTISVPVLTGTKYGISVQLHGFSYHGESVDFSNTAAIAIRLPSGIGISSSSGSFLSQAAPISQVPEPSVWACLLLGIACFGSRKTRKFASPSRTDGNTLSAYRHRSYGTFEASAHID